MRGVMNVAGSVVGIAALVVLAAALLLTMGGPGERLVVQESGAVDTSRGSFQPPPDTPTVGPYPPPWIPTQTPTAGPYPPPMPTETPVPTFPPVETALPTPMPGFAGIEIKVPLLKPREGEKLYVVGLEGVDQSLRVATALEGLGITVVTRYEYGRVIFVSSTPDVIEKALTIPGVVGVTPSGGEAPELSEPYDAETDASWGMKRIEAMVVHQAGYKGSNVIKIANIDTGIDYSHPDLHTPGATRSWINFTDDGGGAYITTPCANDVHRHGQRTSGVIIAADDGEGMVGVAPGVYFTMMRVFKYYPNGICSGLNDWTVNAIYYAINNDYHIINIEAPTAIDYANYRNAIIDAVNAGIIVTIPAGNEPPMEYPALWGIGTIVTAVNDMDRNIGGYVTGDVIDLAAPGEDIYTTDLPNGYILVSGTSVSSAYVAGVAALHLQQGVPANQVEQKMYNEAHDLVENGKDIYTGYGMVLADTTRKQFPRGLASGISIVGAQDPGETSPVYVHFYANGGWIKTKSLTLNGVETSIIYLPNEFATSDPGEVVAKIETTGTGRKYNAIIAHNTSGFPVYSGYRAVELFSNTYLYAPLVENTGTRISSGSVSRIRLMADPLGASSPVSVIFRDPSGNMAYTYNVTVQPGYVTTIPTARIPWGVANRYSVEIWVPSGTWVGGIVETLTTDGKRLSDYPLNGRPLGEVYGYRFLHGVVSGGTWRSSVHIRNTSPTLQATYTVVYHPGLLGGTDVTYTGTIQPNGFVSINPGTWQGNEGAVRITATRNIVAMVRTINYDKHIQADYQADLESDSAYPTYTYSAVNMYGLYNNFCTSSVQNLSTQNYVLAKRGFYWPGGSWMPQARIDSYHAYNFLNSGIPSTVYAGSWGSTNIAGPRWGGPICYNDTNYANGNASTFAAEGTSVASNNRSGPYVRFGTILYTGKWN